MQELATVDSLLAEVSEKLQIMLNKKALDNPLMVGIHTGGAWVAKKLHQQLNIQQPLATLDISFYRDDFSRIGLNPQVKPSQLPPDVENRHIILVDDVLHTGRTIRAAMNELFDYGRPASITLVCLINRSGRELPLQADIIGRKVALSEGEHIKLEGPKPLKLVLHNSDLPKTNLQKNHHTLLNQKR